MEANMTERRTTFVRDRQLRGKSWKLTDPFESGQFFRKLEGLVYDSKGGRSVRWSATKSLKHLATDYARSEFLVRLGVYPKSAFTVVTCCSDGELMCEFLVLGDDGLCYDRAELAANSSLSAWNRSVDYVPTPEDIRRACAAIRKEKPISDYAEQWLGRAGSKVREIKTEDLRHACAYTRTR